MWNWKTDIKKFRQFDEKLIKFDKIFKLVKVFPPNWRIFSWKHYIYFFIKLLLSFWRNFFSVRENFSFLHTLRLCVYGQSSTYLEWISYSRNCFHEIFFNWEGNFHFTLIWLISRNVLCNKFKVMLHSVEITEILSWFSNKIPWNQLSILRYRNWFTNSNSKTMLLATVFVSIFHFPPLSVISIVGVETVAAFLMR